MKYPLNNYFDIVSKCSRFKHKPLGEFLFDIAHDCTKFRVKNVIETFENILNIKMDNPNPW